MSRMKIIATAGFVSLILFFACQKHIDVTPAPPNNPVTPIVPPVNPVPPTENDVVVTASIQGKVTDPNGDPVVSATVTSGVNTVQTDSNGIFRFGSIQTSKYFGYVKVSKPGFFTGSRTIVTSTTAVNYLTVQLVPRTATGNFSASSGGTVVASAGNTVTFPSNGVVTASGGSPYAGAVNVFTTWVDATDPKRNNIMPGDLRGTDTTNHTVGLQTFGLVAVELEGSAGEKLQLATGKTAIISMAIPSTLQANAPTTVSMWYFNDTTGKWIQQGFATKTGNSYTGSVSHFTYWSLDAPSNIVYFSASLKDQNAHALAYARMDISNPTTNDTRTGYADSLGTINGWVQKNTTLSFNVFDNCGLSLLSQSEGPFSTDQNLGNLTVNISQSHLITVHGTAIDCLNNPVANGVVTISLDGMNYSATIANGTFSTSIMRCSTTSTNIQIKATDYFSQMSDSVTVVLNGADVDAGQLTVCSVNFDQYFVYNIDGNTYTISDPPAIFNYATGIQPNTKAYTELSASNGTWGTPGYQSSFFHIQLATTGTTFMYSQSLYIGTTWYSNGFDQINCNVTRYDNSPGYVQGSFSGNMYIDSTGGPHPMTGIFRVKRP